MLFLNDIWVWVKKKGARKRDPTNGGVPFVQLDQPGPKSHNEFFVLLSFDCIGHVFLNDNQKGWIAWLACNGWILAAKERNCM